LQRDIKKISDQRLAMSEQLSGGKLKPKKIEVQVVSHKMQRYAVNFVNKIIKIILNIFKVWFGGSMLASTVNYSINIIDKQIFRPNFTKLPIPRRNIWRRVQAVFAIMLFSEQLPDDMIKLFMFFNAFFYL
jgi:hypothetical protein